MKTVKVKKAELLKVLKKNRAAHRDAFEDAFLGYSRECQRILKENLHALQNNKRHRVMFTEQPPEDHTIEYDRVIRMAEMSVDAVLELSNAEFAQFVQDDWDWRESWALSNSKYVAAARLRR